MHQYGAIYSCFSVMWWITSVSLSKTKKDEESCDLHGVFVFISNCC